MAQIRGRRIFSVDGRYGNRGNASIGVGSNVLGFMSEKDVYRSKGLSLVKIENLPATASEFRAWKNTFLTKVAAIDQTGRDVILDWVMRDFEEGRDVSEFLDSGLLPRLDSHLGSLLMDTRHLKGELGMRFQTYAESCQMARRAPRGRAFLFMLSQHFRLDLNRGSNLTQQALLDLQFGWFLHPKILRSLLKGLNMSRMPFRNHINQQRILGSLGCTQGSRSVSCLQRHIDRIRDSRENSHCRSWDWLMNKIKAVLVEVREDANEESIHASLQTKAKPKPDAKAAVAQNPHDQETTKGLTQSVKGKGRGSEAKKDAQAKPKAEPKDGGKATAPCLFWPKGTCNRGESCLFLHDPKAKPAAKPRAAALANAKATVAVLAAAGGVSRASSLQPNVIRESSTCMHILKSSIRAIVRPFFALLSSCVQPQGLTDSAVGGLLTATPHNE